ncbi:hypothetical protein PGH12_07925 [Chryseobacterium wangxinyae]|uniref:hypothetical protein n=1 Tax=Chryseobacterium sp. CY350 TaxID=2997336 RepID=UPI00226E55AA|nr:hypothetical protein [Chryseobacterium sp. CY350]MCY0977072.1 hypothetical protein [Chryseobacterium sp. CY350]WBZ97070.1 hypothetical protein PGH12_07925 [Chryseobacterium sp. CY350]
MTEPDFFDLSDKDNNLSRRMQGKRRLASESECKVELKKELQLLFNVFYTALAKTNIVLSSFEPSHRSRTFEASVMQSSFAESLSNAFGEKAFYGRYKRLILRTNGYLILFKKLNGKGKPMNIKTINVQSILSQNQVLDLFANSDFNDEPILYFGYQKNRFGQFVNPQLIYIDDGEVNFSINENDLGIKIPTSKNETVNDITEVVPRLKVQNVIKKAN